MLRQHSPVRGFLCSVGLDPEILVEFQYNPTQLSDKRAVNYATLNAPGLLLPIRQYSQGGDRTINFTIQIDGLFKDEERLLDNEGDRRIHIAQSSDGSIAPELHKYRAFLYPETESWPDASTQGFVSLYAEQQHFGNPPRCCFGFGDRPVMDCVVTEVSITETLFNAQLAPLRAAVAVTIVEITPYGNEPTPPPGG